MVEKYENVYGYPWSIASRIVLKWSGEYVFVRRPMRERRASKPHTIFWYIKDGCRKISINHETFEIKSGDLVIFPPYAERIDLDIMEETHFFALSCDAKIGGVDIATLYHFPNVIRSGQLGDISELLEVWLKIIAMLDQLYKHNPHQMLHLQSLSLAQSIQMNTLMSLWYEKLILLLQPLLPSTHSVADRRVFIACRYMEKHIAAKLSITDIAEHLNMSPGYLQALFRQALRISPKQYMNQIRFQLVSELLLQGTASLEQIGESIGYDDPIEFRRWFRRHAGMSIRQFCARSAETIM